MAIQSADHIAKVAAARSRETWILLMESAGGQTPRHLQRVRL